MTKACREWKNEVLWAVSRRTLVETMIDVQWQVLQYCFTQFELWVHSKNAVRQKLISINAARSCVSIVTRSAPGRNRLPRADDFITRADFH